MDKQGRKNDQQIFRTALFILLANLMIACSQSGETPPQGSEPYLHYKYETGSILGRRTLVVFPETVDPQRRWIWRARFLGHQPQVDLKLLEMGYHLAYIDVTDTWGNTTAIKAWDTFYKHVTEKYSLSSKVVLEGMSRGGLIVYNWANRNPEKIQAIYADAPICDIQTTQFKNTILEAYGLTEAQALAEKLNPVDSLEGLASLKIPIIHVVGDQDKIVPVAQHSAKLKNNYEKLGARLKLIHKPDSGHHPHSLADPTVIINYIHH